MTYNVNEIRKDFPALSQCSGKKAPVYFNNACMTLKPQQVMDAMNEYYCLHPGCHRRAIHAFGRLTTQRYASARQTIRKFINARDDREIVFTRNTTEGINIIAQSFPFRQGDVVVTTDMEHNSNLLPWQVIGRTRGIKHRFFSLEPDFSFDMEKFRKLLAEGVKFVSIFQVSHITGASLPAAEIIKLAHEYGALVLLDGAQSAAHQRIDVQQGLDADFLVCSFHKIMGPSGMGMLYAKKTLLESMNPFLVGGETVDDVSYESAQFAPVPERFEAGLQNYAGAMGVEAAIKYFEAIDNQEMRRHEFSLNDLISREILRLPRVSILGPQNAAGRGSIINFSVEGMDSGELSILLDTTNNIMVRSGVHCAHAWYRKKNLAPTVRVSLYLYNTVEEAEIFIQTLRKIAAHF